jgi:hypothetical protein
VRAQCLGDADDHAVGLLPGVHPLERLVVPEEYRIIEAGLLGEDEKVPLVGRVLVAMTPQGGRHAFVIQELSTRERGFPSTGS